jgi:hypothetical protein
MQKDEVIKEKDFEETASNVVEIIKKYRDIIFEINQKKLYNENQFVDFLNKDSVLEKIFNSDIYDIYNIAINSQNHPFRKGLIPNFPNPAQRNQYVHEVTNRTPIKMWKCIGYDDKLFQQNNLINTNSPPQFKPIIKGCFLDLNTIILHILYHINIKDPRRIKLKNKIDEQLKSSRSSYKENREAEIKNKTLKKYLDDSCKNEQKVKTKILGFSTIAPTQSKMLEWMKNDYSEELISNIINILKISKKIKILENKIIPSDINLCNEAAEIIQDDIINLIMENSNG